MKHHFLWPFKKEDGWIGLMAAVVSFAVYAFTCAPNVTLLDSGELITAAQQFGVPHPTGYPLWTLGAWLFSLLPLGNAAWEINLFSGVCGAAAIGVLSAVLNNSLRWLLAQWMEDKENNPALPWLRWMTSVAFPLLFAFSVSMWTQAVIAEVYSLHVLLVMLFVVAVYRWIRQPESNPAFVWVIFFYALGWSNHHLMLSLAPVPVILLLLIRKKGVWELISYLALIASMVYLIFSRLSDFPDTPFADDPATMNTASRFFLCALAGVGVVTWLQRGLKLWKWGGWLLVAVVAGLLPYLYMPTASATNPPMNWGYTQEQTGFYWSINRTQYHGSMSNQLLGTVGRLMGSKPETQPEPRHSLEHKVKNFRQFTALYWVKMVESFHIVSLFCFLFAFVMLLGLDFQRRVWLLTMFVMFLLAAFLEPFFNQPYIDLDSWLVQMPYHAYSFALFAMITGTGACGLSGYLNRRLRIPAPVFLLWFALPLAMGIKNSAVCSQRGHWFGWQFGHDMLKDLPKGSVVFGGTDPGRFVPTYMIFGESPQPPRVKRDPGFDRRDLYIITQNTLLDPFYLKYLRDQYTEKRPPVDSVLERWLGREKMYPEKPVVLPTHDTIQTLLEEVLTDEVKDDSYDRSVAANSRVAQWIFEKNKAEHDFFVEESFPMKWSYPHAVPHGLCYKLNPEPMEALPEEIVQADTAFWDDYKKKLLSDPKFQNDVDARRSFSRLRMTTGNLYQFRGMDEQAEHAWREALELWPASMQVLEKLTPVYAKARRFDELLDLYETAMKWNPYHSGLWQMSLRAVQAQQALKEIAVLKKQWMTAPQPQAAVQLLGYYAVLSDEDEGEAFAEEVLEKFSENSKIYQAVIRFYGLRGKVRQALLTAERWSRAEPENLEIQYLLATFYFLDGEKEKFYELAEAVIDKGGREWRERFALDPRFAPIQGEERFKDL